MRPTTTTTITTTTTTTPFPLPVPPRPPIATDDSLAGSVRSGGLNARARKTSSRGFSEEWRPPRNHALSLRSRYSTDMIGNIRYISIATTGKKKNVIFPIRLVLNTNMSIQTGGTICGGHKKIKLICQLFQFSPKRWSTGSK